MPSNTLALGLYERCILKRTFRHTTGFCRFREGERRRLSIGNNFLQQLRRSGVFRVCGEKVAAVRTEKLGTHSHTHTHTHTHTLTHRTTAIPSLLACGGEGNDRRTTKVLSSRPRITCGETNNLFMLDPCLMTQRRPQDKQLGPMLVTLA